MIGQSRPRRLLLCLDGVPHSLIEQDLGRGLFDSLKAPDAEDVKLEMIDLGNIHDTADQEPNIEDL